MLHRRLSAALLALALGLAALAPASLSAQSLCPGLVRPVIAYAFEQLTVAGASTPFTAATYGASSRTVVMATFNVETAPIRYRDDGTAPTAAIGQLALDGSYLVVCGNSVPQFKAIRTSGVSAVLNVTFYRYE